MAAARTVATAPSNKKRAHECAPVPHPNPIAYSLDPLIVWRQAETSAWTSDS